MFRGSGAATLRALERIPPVCPPSCPALFLCGQIGCCIPSWSLSTTATTSSTRASHGDAESAGMGRCHGQSPVSSGDGEALCSSRRKAASLALPPIVSLCCILPLLSSTSGAQLPQRHPPPAPLPEVLLTAGSHLERSDNQICCSSGFIPVKHSSLLILGRGCGGSR